MSLLSALLNSGKAGIIGATSGTLLTGGVFIYFSDGSRENTYLLRAIPDESSDLSRTSFDGKDFHDAKLVNHSYVELINGTRSYNGGNYIIYYGSEACPHCTHFLFGSPALARGNLIKGRDRMSDGTYMDAFEFVNSDQDLKDKKIKFLMYSDTPQITGEETTDDRWDLPWSRWGETDLGKGAIKGEYKRHDQSAVEFRKVMDAAVERFGNDKAGGTPTVIVYWEGVGKVFNRDELPGLTSEKQGEDLSSAYQLKRYIKWYYKNVKR